MALPDWRQWLRRQRVGRRVRLVAAWGRLAGARFDYPRLIERPPGERILVLSPHPDDAAIGPGGTLAKHHAAGARVTCLVLTDGGAGAPGEQRADVARTRRREEEAAAGRLGIARVIFWDEPDGALEPRPANVERLRALLVELRPDLVYLPAFLDAHPDHRAVTPLLARALQDVDLTFSCAVYEFGTPLVPNVLVDVGPFLETKLTAVREHRSQLLQRDYAELVVALARWRGGVYARDLRYAEAFHLDEVGSYLALWRAATTGRAALRTPGA